MKFHFFKNDLYQVHVLYVKVCLLCLNGSNTRPCSVFLLKELGLLIRMKTIFKEVESRFLIGFEKGQNRRFLPGDNERCQICVCYLFKTACHGWNSDETHHSLFRTNATSTDTTLPKHVIYTECILSCYVYHFFAHDGYLNLLIKSILKYTTKDTLNFQKLSTI